MTLFAFFSSGTEAIERAMRVARAATGRHGFVGVHDDYHGRTGGAASVTARRSSNGPRDPGSWLVPNGHCYRCSFGLRHPDCQLRCARFVVESLAQHGPDDLAGLVIEPVTNGSGAHVHQPGYLSTLAEVVRRAGGLVIADEVASGFGRTGRWFACEHDDVTPDVMALGKGMGNGFPVAAIAVHEELADALAASFASTTYGGNPLACAAVTEVIAVMQEEGLVEHCARLGEVALRAMRALIDRHPIVGDVRGRGALLAIELVKDRSTREPFPEAGNHVYQEAFRRGVAWASAGSILRITPPIVMTAEVFLKGLSIVEEAITVTEQRFGYAT